MNTKSLNIKKISLRATFFMMFVLAFASLGKAFDLSTYAEKSVLSQGRWVKVTIEESGIYALTRSTLSRMGFTDPARVRIYGYGGQLFGNRLAVDNYIDDLPPVVTHLTESGSVVFYGVGASYWTTSANTHKIKYHNNYISSGTYFVTEVDGDTAETPTIETAGIPEVNGTPASTFTERLHHEVDLESPGEAGAAMVGEDFKYNSRRTFDFSLPNRTSDNAIWLELSFVAKTYNQSSSVDALVNGSSIFPSTVTISPTSNDDYSHGSERIGRSTFDYEGDKLSVTIEHKSPVTVHGAWLNYLSINYTRNIELPSSGILSFWHNRTALSLSGVKKTVTVWDVTNPRSIYQIQTSDVNNGTVTWTNTKYGEREYVAFADDAAFPEPTIVGSVTNQNLHALTDADMVIITLPAWHTQAERLADIHRGAGDDPLNVIVVDAQSIYNEFGSGGATPQAIRNFLKMIYDRSKAQGKGLRYALLMGRATYDNRCVTEKFKALDIQTLPTWYDYGMYTSLNDKSGYGCDDFMAMLDDNSGYDMSIDDLSIGLGRMPVRSLSEATQDIDKIKDYIERSKVTPWRNQVMVLADDQDNGVHVSQAEKMTAALNPEGSETYVVNKVYMDAYTRVGKNYPDARSAMFRYLDEGTMFWLYLGHANNHSWTHDGQLTNTDINSMYLKHVPILFAGTCDFARWDSNTLSGAEIMYHERYGGVVGLISATRPVYISDNGLYAEALGRAMAKRDDEGRTLRLGDIYRLSKNDIRDSRGNHISNSNRLRYILMGDPALKSVMPDNRVRLDRIADIDVTSTDGDDGTQIILPALSRPRFAGAVTDPQGNVLSDFNGSMQLTIYDADFSSVTNGYGSEGAEMPFDQHGSKLYTGIIPVKNGLFDDVIAMPGEIADNFRPATANLYAYDPTTGKQASSVNKSFYVYGFDENAAVDDTPPTIDALYLNHETFSSGDAVNTTPTLIARVSDDVAINISTAGIGHQMSLTLDGKKTFDDIALYYTPSSDGSPSGTITYPIDELTKGNHTLRLRVWDTSNNCTEAEIEFNVDPRATPKIYDIYSDANPASTQANFYITSDRPEQMTTVTVTVYNLLGHALWTKTVTGVNDMFTTTPVTWDLTDSRGQRVPRGIYVYRAQITDNDDTYDTGARRIAVTAH